jgi:hypothetical protein
MVLGIVHYVSIVWRCPPFSEETKQFNGAKNHMLWYYELLLLSIVSHCFPFSKETEQCNAAKTSRRHLLAALTAIQINASSLFLRGEGG